MLTKTKSSNIFMQEVERKLAERTDKDLLRILPDVETLDAVTVRKNGKALTNFASNDYLGMSQHEELKKRSIEYIRKYGVGSPSSRLIAGNNSLTERVEAKIARLKKTESCLIFSSGFQLNSTVLPLLAMISESMLMDRLCHYSMLGGVSSHFRSGKCKRFKHNDLNDLEIKLSKTQSQNFNSWIVTESIFSMDGDILDISALEKLCRKNSLNLYVDEAHATGVAGDNGFGCVKPNDTTVTMGTFGKGAGSFGAYIACSKKLRNYIVNFTPGFIYTTALPPSVIGSIDAAVDLIPALDYERSYLKNISNEAREKIESLGFSCGNSKSHIVPIIVGDSESALSLSRHLEDNGILAPAIRYPTVEDYTARVRLSLSAAHKKENLDLLFKSLSSWKDKRKSNA